MKFYLIFFAFLLVIPWGQAGTANASDCGNHQTQEKSPEQRQPQSQQVEESDLRRDYSDVREARRNHPESDLLDRIERFQTRGEQARY